MIDVNEVRRITELVTSSGFPAGILAQFARAVLNPPAEVAEAIRCYRLNQPPWDTIAIVDYYLSLTAAPEKSA